MKRVKSFILIDDDQVTNKVNTKLLEGMKGSEQVFTFDNPYNGIEFLKKINPTLLPTMVFLDVHMPQMDGEKFLNEYYRMKLPHQNSIYINLLSNLNPAELATRFKNTQINNILSKPLSQIQINYLLLGDIAFPLS